MPRARPSPTSPLSRRRNDLLCRFLVEARKEARLTQAALGKRLGCHQSFVAKYERGGRKLDVPEFLDVCAAIGCDALAMLGTLCKEAPAATRARADGGCGCGSH